MKRKMTLILPAVLVLTGCSSLFTNVDDRDAHSAYRTETPDGRPLPPPDDRYGTFNGSNSGYHNNPPAGHGDRYASNDNRHSPAPNNNGNYYYRPEMGTMVTSLGVSNPRTIKVNGETIYDVNNVYYKAVRTSAGIRYQVVGYTNR